MKRFALVALLWAAPGWAGEVETLKAQLVEPNDALAEEAATKLGASKDPKGLDAILDALAVGAPPRVQAALLAGLAGRREPRAIDVLKLYARNRNPLLRRQALAALGELTGDDAKKVMPLLLDALADSAPEVRAQVASVLGSKKERQAESRLVKLLQRQDEAAAKALAQMATPDLAHRLSELLGQIPDALLCTAMGEMLKRPDFGPDPIRLELVKTLSKMPGVDSTTTLIEYVMATEKDKTRPSRVEAQKLLEQRSSQ